MFLQLEKRNSEGTQNSMLRAALFMYLFVYLFIQQYNYEDFSAFTTETKVLAEKQTLSLTCFLLHS